MKSFLKLGVSAAALSVAMSAPAFAQSVVTQTPTNSANITAGTAGATDVTIGGVTADGDAASAFVSATGAAASESQLANAGAPAVVAGGFTITQTSTNNAPATITSNGDIEFTAADGVAGDGASAFAGATGASSSVTSQAINNAGLITFNDVNNVGQTSTNNGPINVTDNSIQPNGGSIPLAGVGASAGIGGTGARANVGVSSVIGNGVAAIVGDVDPGGGIGIDQDADNTGAITVSGGDIDITTIPTSGVAASATISATGAGSSVSGALITDSGAGANALSFAPALQINQDSVNDGTIANTGGRVDGTGVAATQGTMAISSTGASNGVGMNVIGGTGVNGAAGFGVGGTIIQNADNNQTVDASTGQVTVTGADIGGAFSAGAISSTGASNSLSYTANDSATNALAVTFGNATATSNNDSGITVDGTVQTATTGALAGTGASMAISGVGARDSASVSLAGGGGAHTTAATFGSYEGATVNSGTIAVQTSTVQTATGSGITGNGASMSISGAGAVRSVSERAADLNSTGTNQFGAIGAAGTLEADNSGLVNIILGANVLPGAAITGNGASATINGTGAAASVSSSTLDGGGGITTMNGGTFGNVDFDANNTAAVTVGAGGVTTRVFVGDAAGPTPADIDGNGARASTGASGASASVSELSINALSRTGGTFGTIDLEADNTQGITNINTSVTAANVDGNGASAGITGSGAATSVGSTAINTATHDVSTFGNITQAADNTSATAVINVQDATVTVDQIDGIGANAGIASNGASNGVSVTGINVATSFGGATFGTITQTANDTPNPAGAVQLVNADVAGDRVNGIGGSATLNARAAGNSIGVSSVNSVMNAATDFGGAITQNATNNAAPVSIDNASSIILDTASAGAGLVSGSGAAVVASAGGAGNSFSLGALGGSVGTGAAPILTIGAGINQTANNEATIGNSATITTGTVSGTGSSVGSSTSGASNSVGVNFVGTQLNAGGDVTVAGNIVQAADNAATGVITSATPITVADISGRGASVSSSAVGASSGVSIALVDIVAGPTIPTITAPVITQTSTNLAAVTNTSTVTAGAISGVGASAGISAVGAATSVSVSTVLIN